MAMGLMRMTNYLCVFCLVHWTCRFSLKLECYPSDSSSFSSNICLAWDGFFGKKVHNLCIAPALRQTRGAAGGQLIEVSHPNPPSESINTDFHPLLHPLTQRKHLTALAKTLYFARNSLH